MKKLLLVLSFAVLGLNGCFFGEHRDEDLIRGQEHQRGHKDHDRRDDHRDERDHDERHDGRY
jgi:hypothetical protein